MENINFTPLFEYFDGMKAELKTAILRVETKVDNLQTSFDGLAKTVKEHTEEILEAVLKISL